MDDGGATPDHVQPFLLEGPRLRGRIVRLPTVAQDIIAAHGYPDAIAEILAEALCLTTLLAGMLKFDGVFTLQAKGNAVLKTLVCDMTNNGDLRGYAGYDADALAQLDNPTFETVTGGGYLAFTVDQAMATDRYQGIVALDKSSLRKCVLEYFAQSEQIKTAFITHVEKNLNGDWIAGALMLQHLPGEGGHDVKPVHDMNDENWLRSMMLMQTLKQDEMLDAATPLNTLLYRLFHEEGVRVFKPIAITKSCRCNIDKIRAVIDSLSLEERQDIAENGLIKVTCEFCNTTYEFPAEV